MTEKQFKIRTKYLRDQIHALVMEEGVCYNTALYAYLTTAENCMSLAVVRACELKEIKDIDKDDEKENNK